MALSCQQAQWHRRLRCLIPRRRSTPPCSRSLARFRLERPGSRWPSVPAGRRPPRGGAVGRAAGGQLQAAAAAAAGQPAAAPRGARFQETGTCSRHAAGVPARTDEALASERAHLHCYPARLHACMPLKIADQLCRLGVLGDQAEQDENCHCRCRQCCCCYPPSMALSELLLCCRTLLRIILRATVPSAIISYYVTSRRSGWRCRGGSDDG